jgi:hypothetical protein
MRSSTGEMLVYDVSAFVNIKFDKKLKNQWLILAGQRHLSMSYSISICFYSPFVIIHKNNKWSHFKVQPFSAVSPKPNRSKCGCCLCQVFNSKLGRFVAKQDVLYSLVRPLLKLKTLSITCPICQGTTSLRITAYNKMTLSIMTQQNTTQLMLSVVILSVFMLSVAAPW